MNSFEHDETREMSAEEKAEINEKTRVPIGLAVCCIGAFIGGALWLNNSLNRIDQRLQSMETRMSDRWTASNMKIWALQLRLENPSLRVPEPETK